MLIILGQITWLTQQTDREAAQAVPEVAAVVVLEPPQLPELRQEAAATPTANPVPRYTPTLPPEVAVPPIQVEIPVGRPGARMAGLFPRGFQPETEVVPFDTLDRRPNVLRRGALEYPAELRRERVTGHVKLKVMILETGAVRVMEVVESTHRGFERAAIRAAEGSLFEPPLRNGQAVRTAFYLPITFQLD